MNTIVLEAQKAELARKVLNLADERMINRLMKFFAQIEAPVLAKQSSLYRDIDASLGELKNVLDGNKQAKSFQQFLDEI